MNIEQNNIDALHAELIIHLEPADYNERYEKKLKEYRKNMQLPGFRPGAVPVSLIKQRYGKELLSEEINHLLRDAIYKYIEEKKIEVLGSPLPKRTDEVQGNWDEPGNFRFSYELGIAPDLNFTLDKNIKLTLHKVRIDDTLIDRQTKDLARRYGKMSEPEIAGDEDLLVCGFAELDGDGNIKEGGIASKSTVSIEFIKDRVTKEQLVGLKKGDTVDVDPNMLSDNHEDLAKMLGITHHDVHHLHSLFRLAVLEIKHIEPHAIDQELFDKLYGKDTVTTAVEMRTRVKTDLEKVFEQDSEWMFRKQASSELVKLVNPKLPDEFLKRFIAMTSERPVSFEDVDYSYPLYARGIRWDLVSDKIAKDFSISVVYDELVQHVKNSITAQYARYAIPLDEAHIADMVKKHLEEKEQLKQVYETMKENKLMHEIKERCTIVEKEISLEEFTHMAQHMH